MIAREEFRALPGFEDKVKVNNLGTRAINLNYYNTGKVRDFKLSRDPRGYFRFGFYYKGKYYNFGIHQAVAMAFIPNPDNLPEVNHKDENPSNNRVDNLEWCTHSYNNSYGTRIERFIKSKSKRVACYKNGKPVKIYPSTKSVTQDGFSQSSVSRCCNGHIKTYPRGLYTWRFLD